MELPVSFPKGTLFAEVEGALCSYNPLDLHAVVWEESKSYNIPVISFKSKGVEISEANFRGLYFEIEYINYLKRELESYKKQLAENNLSKAKLIHIAGVHFLMQHEMDRSETNLDMEKKRQIINAFVWGIANEKSRTAKNAVAKRLAVDPKQLEKAFVRECWLKWKKTPGSYKSKAAFARDMLNKVENLVSHRIIEGWCRKWESQSKVAAIATTQ